MASGFQKLVLCPFGSLVFMEQNMSTFSFSTAAPTQGIVLSDSPISVNAATIHSVAQVLKLGIIFAKFYDFSFLLHPTSSSSANGQETFTSHLSPSVRLQCYPLIPATIPSLLEWSSSLYHWSLCYLLPCTVSSSYRSENDL